MFQPQKEPSAETLQRLSNQYFQRINAKPLPLRITREDWDKALDIARNALEYWARASTSPYKEESAARNTAHQVAQDTFRSPAWNIAYSITLRVAGYSSNRRDLSYLDARSAAVDAATWITVEDLMPQHDYDKGNPWQPLFEGIYDKGYWFIGPIDRKSVIFVPPIKKAA